MKKILLALLMLGMLQANEEEMSGHKKNLQKECDKGDYASCIVLGLSYEIGYGVRQDYFKAKELYEKACNDGVASGCYNLGTMYNNGNGVRQDYFKAKEFFGKACDLKNEFGCKTYAELNQQGY